MDHYKIVGIDLAKDVFQVCALNQGNTMVFNQRVTRMKLVKIVTQLPPSSVIAMEACGSANYWARRFEAMGHQVKLIPAQHVKAFLRCNKNDANDALAICEAALRPNIHPVPIKPIALQDMQFLHRVRQRHVKNRTAVANQMRALLRENGIVVAKQLAKLRRAIYAPCPLPPAPCALRGKFCWGESSNVDTFLISACRLARNVGVRRLTRNLPTPAKAPRRCAARNTPRTASLTARIAA